MLGEELFELKPDAGRRTNEYRLATSNFRTDIWEGHWSREVPAEPAPRTDKVCLSAFWEKHSWIFQRAVWWGARRNEASQARNQCQSGFFTSKPNQQRHLLTINLLLGTPRYGNSYIQNALLKAVVRHYFLVIIWALEITCLFSRNY